MRRECRNLFQFSCNIVGNEKRGKKHRGDSVTVSQGKPEEDISCAGQSITPNRGKTPYKGNQEMSDESRNEL